jgi:hypothetical protein
MTWTLTSVAISAVHHLPTQALLLRSRNLWDRRSMTWRRIIQLLTIGLAIGVVVAFGRR